MSSREKALSEIEIDLHGHYSSVDHADMTWNELYDNIGEQAQGLIARNRNAAKEAFVRNKVPKKSRTLGTFRIIEGPGRLSYAVPLEIDVEGKPYELRPNGALISPDADLSQLETKELNIGSRTILKAGVELLGTVSIGRRSIIEEDVIISDSDVGDQVTVGREAEIYNSIVGKIQPVKDNPRPTLTVLLESRDAVSIGNEAYLTNARIGEGAKIGKLAMIGRMGRGYITLGRNVQVEEGALVKSSRWGKYIKSGTFVRRGRGSSINRLRRGNRR